MATKLKVFHDAANESDDKVFGLKLVQHGDDSVTVVLTDAKGVMLECGTLLTFTVGKAVKLYSGIDKNCPFQVDDDRRLLTRYR